MISRKVEIWVGLLMLMAIAAFLFLTFSVSNFSFSQSDEQYTLYAKFDNVGGLKVRAPIKVGGVVVGRVSSIALDASDYSPLVTLSVSKHFGQFPETSSVAILTSGLLGEQYIGLEPGFVDDDIVFLEPGDYIEDTKSALVLEDLIGQVLFSIGSKDE